VSSIGESTTSSNPSADRARRSSFRAALNRRSLGKAIMVAAVVACVTALIGVVVAWRLVGDLSHTTQSSLVIVSDTLATVDDTLELADSIIDTVDDGIETVGNSLSTISSTVEDGGATLDVFADLTSNLAPSLERIDSGLGGLQSTVGVVDDFLRQVSAAPFGPDYNVETGLASSVQAVRDDLRPIADDLEGASGTLNRLASSSDDVIARLDELAQDLGDIDRSLDESRDLIERYRRSTAEAAALTAATLDDLDRDVWLSRLLIVVLGVAIAVGQLAPFHIGRELARSPLRPEGVDLAPPANGASGMPS
jgi:methyl-accepting chemotaxis protein